MATQNTLYIDGDGSALGLVIPIIFIILYLYARPIITLWKHNIFFITETDI